jgi:hypothetical protein
VETFQRSFPQDPGKFCTLFTSLFPTAVQLFVVFPHAGKGTAGLELGMLTPLFVLVVNWIWGFTTAMTIKFAK